MMEPKYCHLPTNELMGPGKDCQQLLTTQKERVSQDAPLMEEANYEMTLPKEKPDLNLVKPQDTNANS